MTKKRSLVSIGLPDLVAETSDVPNKHNTITETYDVTEKIKHNTETYNVTEKIKHNTEANTDSSLRGQFKEIKNKKTVEDTHTRQTFLIQNDLLERFEKAARNEKRGFKTFFINHVLKKALEEFETVGEDEPGND